MMKQIKQQHLNLNQYRAYIMLILLICHLVVNNE